MILAAREDTRDLTIESVLRYTDDARAVSVEQTAGVTLVGGPTWPAWKCRQRLVQTYTDGRVHTLERVFASDGVYYYNIQDDGMGGLNQRDAASRWFAQGNGIYLSHSWLDRWHQQFRDPSLTIAPVPGKPSHVRLSWRGRWRELDTQRGCMPVRYVHETPEGEIQYEFFYEDYAQYGPLWLPRRMHGTWLNGPMELTVRDVQVNRGLTPEMMRLRFPYGTSLSLSEGTRMVWGMDNPTEAEDALRNWLAYFDTFGRSSPSTQPAADADPLALGKPISADDGANGRDREADAYIRLSGASAARAVYAALLLYRKDPSLPALDAEVARGIDAFRLARMCASLSRAGLRPAARQLTVEELERCGCPVILEVCPFDSRERHTEYAVVAGSSNGTFTMIDPNPYGRLRPWDVEMLKRRWNGRAIIVAPPQPRQTEQ